MMDEGVEYYKRDKAERISRNLIPIEHFYTSLDSNTKEEIWTDFLAEVQHYGKILFACHIVS
jgi:hypothetical protein